MTKDKTAIWILDIGEYNRAIYNMCVPTIERYAKKIKADLNIITERKFPDWHVTYEKAQVYELGKEYQWNLVMDTDVLFHPSCPDFRHVVQDYMVGLKESYSADAVFNLNSNFYRDRRKMGINAVFAMASHHCHDFWTPLPGKQEDHLEMIHMRPEEVERGVPKEHFITEYWLSNNLAKYGLQYNGILENSKQWLFYHTYFAPTEEQKIKELKEKLESWQND